MKCMYGGADPAGDSTPSTLNNRAKLIDIEVSSDSDDEHVDSGSPLYFNRRFLPS